MIAVSVTTFGLNITRLLLFLCNTGINVLESHVDMKTIVSMTSNKSQWQVREHDVRRKNSGEEQKQKPRSAGGT